MLAGIGSLTIVDNQVCETSDLSTQFFINQNHIDNKKTRAEASLDQLQQLNPYVKITELKTSDFNSINFKQFQSVVLTEVKNLNQCIQINELCRANEIKFIMSDFNTLAKKWDKPIDILHKIHHVS